jgi:hypothetical protein
MYVPSRTVTSNDYKRLDLDGIDDVLFMLEYETNAALSSSVYEPIRFRTGFESDNAQPTWNDAIEYAKNAGGPLWCHLRGDSVAHSGRAVLMYSGSVSGTSVYLALSAWRAITPSLREEIAYQLLMRAEHRLRRMRDASGCLQQNLVTSDSLPCAKRRSKSKRGSDDR